MVKRSADHRRAGENGSRIPEGCQKDADARIGSRTGFRMRAVAERAGTPPGCDGFGGSVFRGYPGVSGGIASLNPRLIAPTPPGYNPHPSPSTDKGAVASIRKWLEQHGVEP